MEYILSQILIGGSNLIMPGLSRKEWNCFFMEAAISSGVAAIEAPARAHEGFYRIFIVLNGNEIEVACNDYERAFLSSGTTTGISTGFKPAAGVYTLEVEASDNAGNIATSEPRFFVVYDPTGGFATGGGWINPDSESTLPGGKASFGFVAKYKDSKSTGNLEFQYKDADINLKSTTIDWLAISGVSAQFQGTGTINGEGIYTFRVLAKDNGEPGEGVDTFDIMIWQGTDTSADPVHKAKNVLAGGNIVVHKK